MFPYKKKIVDRKQTVSEYSYFFFTSIRIPFTAIIIFFFFTYIRSEIG